MTLKVRITWANAGHTLLPESLADVRIEAGGSALPFTRKSTGVREVEIPDGTAKVTLKATFSVKFGAVGSEPPMEQEVWRAEQPYEVTSGGTALTPTDLPQYVKSHPLVETHMASGTNGAALIRLRTEFVDITQFWLSYAKNADEYLVDHHPKAKLLALGYTGGDPKIWFASFTDASAAPPKAGISSLVFYRPATSYTHTRIDQVHDMYGLNRFLLKPVDDPNADYWKRDMFLPYKKSAPGGGTTDAFYAWLRCGFEDAMDRSGKAVVMIHPWPNGTAFGDAAGPKLPALAEGVIRFLWARQRIAKNRGAIHLGRLGISGYSAGGLALWGALGSNLDRVDEVYSFDAVGAGGAAAQVIQWFNKKPSSRCLRMTSGHQFQAHTSIQQAIEKLTGKTARVSGDPPTSAGYDPGKNPLWDHVRTVSDKSAAPWPDIQKTPAYWHQFAVFGGYIALPGPMALTFMQRFLQDSDF